MATNLRKYRATNLRKYMATNLNVVVSRLEKSAVKSSEAYQWFTYSGKMLTLESAKGYKLVLNKGSQFGVRKSSNGKFIRLVAPKQESKVFTLDLDMATRIAKYSTPVKMSNVPKDAPKDLRQGLADEKIPKSWFKSKLESNKNSFWVADRHNIPISNKQGDLIPLHVNKISKFVYRAMPMSVYVKFISKPIVKNKGIYFTSDLGDALTWATIFGADDSNGSVVVQYTGKLDTKYFAEPDQLDHPNHVAYTGPMDSKKFKVLCTLSKRFASENA
jgi:hypothetical protein